MPPDVLTREQLEATRATFPFEELGGGRVRMSDPVTGETHIIWVFGEFGQAVYDAAHVATPAVADGDITAPTVPPTTPPPPGTQWQWDSSNARWVAQPVEAQPDLPPTVLPPSEFLAGLPSGFEAVFNVGTQQWIPRPVPPTPPQNWQQRVTELLLSDEVGSDAEAQRIWGFWNQLDPGAKVDLAMRLTTSPGDFITYWALLRGDQPNVPFEAGVRRIPFAQLLQDAGLQAGLLTLGVPTERQETPEGAVEEAEDIARRAPPVPPTLPPTEEEGIPPEAQPRVPPVAAFPTLQGAQAFRPAPLGEPQFPQELREMTTASVAPGQETVTALPGLTAQIPDTFLPTPQTEDVARRMPPLTGTVLSADQAEAEQRARLGLPQATVVGTDGPELAVVGEFGPEVVLSPFGQPVGFHSLGTFPLLAGAEREAAAQGPAFGQTRAVRKPRLLPTLGAPRFLSAQGLGRTLPSQREALGTQVELGGFPLPDWLFQQQQQLPTFPQRGPLRTQQRFITSRV